MTVYKESIFVESHGGTPSYIDVTPGVKDAIARSGVKEGICVVLTPHTTCSVFFEEFVHDTYDDGTEFLQADLNDVLAKIIPDQTDLPPAGEYKYPGEEHFRDVESWPNAADFLPGGDRRALLNADAHLKSTILGSSETFEVTEGRLGVGVTGYVYFVDFDRSRPRKRTCRVVVMGD